MFHLSCLTPSRYKWILSQNGRPGDRKIPQMWTFNRIDHLSRDTEFWAIPIRWDHRMVEMLPRLEQTDQRRDLRQRWLILHTVLSKVSFLLTCHVQMGLSENRIYPIDCYGSCYFNGEMTTIKFWGDPIYIYLYQMPTGSTNLCILILCRNLFSLICLVPGCGPVNRLTETCWRVDENCFFLLHVEYISISL